MQKPTEKPLKENDVLVLVIISFSKILQLQIVYTLAFKETQTKHDQLCTNSVTYAQRTWLSLRNLLCEHGGPLYLAK